MTFRGAGKLGIKDISQGQACDLTKKVNKAEELTHLTTNIVKGY